MSEKVTIRRVGDVVHEGAVIGSVFGQPRDWWFALPGGSGSSRTPAGPWHGRQEAAQMLLRASREKAVMRSDPDPEQIITELINADRAFRWAMFNSNSEASWADERKRWDAARQAALAAYPGIAARLED